MHINHTGSSLGLREDFVCNTVPSASRLRGLGQDSALLVRQSSHHHICNHPFSRISDRLLGSRDLSTTTAGAPLTSLGSISSHTRPVECLDGYSESSTSAVLYTADTMGVIKVWDLDKQAGSPPRWHSTLRAELNHHRTRINERIFGNGQLWTGTALFCCSHTICC